MGERVIAEMLALAKDTGRLRGLHEALALVAETRAAYSEDVFPWPSTKVPPTLDAVSARMARLVCDGLTKGLRDAIDADEEDRRGGPVVLSPDEARRLLAEGREAQAEMRRRLRSMEDVRDVPSDERRARTPLSPDAAAARKPLPPEQLVNALNDRVHHDIGRARAAQVHRPSDERPGERPGGEVE